MQGERRWLELLCPSCRMSPQRVGHKPILAQNTWGHWLCAFAPLPQVLLRPLTCLPQGEWRQTMGMLRPHRRLHAFLCPNPMQVCQLVECGCDQVLDHCLSPPSPPSGQDNRIPALDLPGDCDEKPHLPLACKWQCDCPAGQVLYLDIKSRRFLLQCSPPNHHFTAVCSSLGSRWRSSSVAGVTNSQDEACGSDMDKRRA